MAYKEVTIDSVRYAEVNGKWVTILKRKDADEYFPIYMSASKANIIKRELIPGRFGDLWGYERFLVGRDITEYNLESLTIDEPDGNVRARLLFTKGDSIMEIECPVAGAIALAFRRKVRIFADEDSFYTAVSDTSLLPLLTT
jgi:bifunctional DNase/RNase